MKPLLTLHPFQKCLDLLFQHWEVSFHRFPHLLQVHSEILVNEHVPHGDDLRPGYLRV